VPAVGPLFFPSVAGLLPTLGAPHSCTGSVVHSARGDLVITAAHCVYGIGATIEFVPDFLRIHKTPELREFALAAPLLVKQSLHDLR